MVFLKNLNQKSDLMSQIESLNHNTKAGIENTRKQFTNFCEEQGSSFEEAIEEMKIAQNKRYAYFFRRRSLLFITVPQYLQMTWLVSKSVLSFACRQLFSFSL